MEMEMMLRELEREGHKRAVPICGPVKGMFLEILANIREPKHILELGTAIGYSTLILAIAAPQARIITVDSSREWQEEAEDNLERAGVKNVEFVKGDAIEYLKSSKEEFDFIFLDIQKSEYIKALPHCIERLSKGGVLAADNALWEEVEGYNKACGKDGRLLHVVVPLEDGMAVSLKKWG